MVVTYATEEEMETPRQRQWQQNFARNVRAEMKFPFDWREHNCAHLMAVAVRSCYGDDHPALAEIREWESEEDAKAQLRDGRGLYYILGKYFKQIPVLRAQDADIGLFRNGEKGPWSGCVVVDGSAIGRSEEMSNRTFIMPIRTLQHVYRV